MSITRNHLAKSLAERMGMNKRETKELVADFFDIIADSLVCNEPVKLSGFGKFILRDKKARPGRNPKTGEPKLIAARRVVIFKAGEKLKQKVMQYDGDQGEEQTG